MPSERTLEALYRLNKAAKFYAEDAADAYDVDDGEYARIASCRKTALYRFKTYILQKWYSEGDIDRVDRHTIDGRAYYCLTVDGWQFHAPVDQWASIAIAVSSDDPDPEILTPDVSVPPSPDAAVSLATDAVTNERTLNDFAADSQPTATPDLSQAEALSHLGSIFSASPNNFLDQSFIDVGWHRPDLRFTGWSELPHAQKPPEPPEEGERVAVGELDDQEQDKFLFDAGETVETFDRGHITIENRYGIYEVPFHSHANWPIPKPAYDLQFEDEDHAETDVDQDTLFGYHILLDDPTAPKQTFEGRLADFVQDIDPAFSIGDTIVFDDGGPRTNDPTTATVTAFAVWENLIECRLEHDDGSIYWDPYDDIIPSVDKIQSA
jgi:hypothetical protein